MACTSYVPGGIGGYPRTRIKDVVSCHGVLGSKTLVLRKIVTEPFLITSFDMFVWPMLSSRLDFSYSSTGICSIAVYHNT